MKEQQQQQQLLQIPKEETETFLLMQLPDGLSVESLKNNASLVGSSHKEGAAQACLVTSDKSFALSRVETSNAYILMPPPAAAVDDDAPPHKKAKLDSDDTAAAPTPCRLLGGGSGAYFLELKERQLDLKALEGLLNTFDPYDSDNSKFEGKSLPQLALALLVSEKQVLDGLNILQQALEYQSNYCILSEEAFQDARRAILGALTECDDFGDYSREGVEELKFVQESMERAEQYPQLESAIRLVLRAMTKKGGEKGFPRIDFQKVAVFCAHELFAKPVWSNHDLVKEWQARVPGVGKDYHVGGDDMHAFLKGVAIFQKEDETWHYLPADKLAKSPEERLAQLFRAKDFWTSDELEPYLVPLTTKMDRVLLKHARTTSQEEADGTSIAGFAKKQ